MSNKRKHSQENVASSSKHFKSAQVEKRAGCIKCIILHNFMCHSLLEVDFQKNVNFLTGRNGSGKSAILTALVVGLGAKASLTNRGNNVKGFIKMGENSGYVEIILYNQGFNAYKRELYGNFIRIQRSFTASGSSSYKVKAESGKMITKSAREVHNIVTYLGIQIENPICILNQDTARNFLSTSDPKHKYQLFMRGTRLDIVWEEREKLKAHIETTFELLAEKENQLKEVKIEMTEMKKTYDEHISVLEKKNELRELQGELLWSIVRDTEADCERYRARLKAAEDEVKAMEDEITSNGDKYIAVQEKISALQRQILEIKEALQIEKVPEIDTRKMLAELREKFSERKRKIENLERGMKAKIQQCAAITQEIEEAEKNREEIEREKVEKEATCEQYREELSEVENILETSKNDLFTLKTDAIQQKEEQENQLKGEIAHIDQNIRHNHAMLNALELEQNNSLALYGRHVVQIVEQIKARRHEFQHVPRGPLGSYITLRDRKWAATVEDILGAGLLGAFTVDNEKDNAILKAIFRSVCGSNTPPILITSKFFFQVHDVTRYKVQVPQDCLSLFDVLNFSDPVVANCMIDQHGIESILLMPNDEVALALLSETENVPNNCKYGVTLRGDTYYPSPNFRMYSGKLKQPRYLQVDTGERMRQIREQLESLENRKQVTQNQYDVFAQEKQKFLKQQNEIEVKIRQLRNRRAQLLRALDELESTADRETANIEDLRNEMEILKTSMAPIEAKVEKLKTEISEIKEQIAETEERFKEITRSVCEMEERIAPLELKLLEEQGRISELESSRRFAATQLEELKESEDRAKAALEQQEEKLRRDIEKAKNMAHDKIENVRPVPQIVARIEELDKSVKRLQGQVVKPEELKLQYDNMHERYNKMQQMCNDLKDEAKELRSAYTRRRDNFKKLRKCSIRLMMYEFENVLEFRQFKGTVKVNTEDGTLELVVIPHQGAQGLIKNANLSGGERSFTTVAFLYALWKCTSLPFYILDEFDVYMDKLNRTKAMEILMYQAKQRSDRLYVFLTPQDVSFIRDDSVAVHKLEDPKRSAN